MPQHLHLDFETFSEAELKDVGAYRYSHDPSTEILCAAMALGDEEPVVWSLDREPINGKLLECMAALEDPSVLIYCHNAQFEMAICQALLQKTWGISCPDLSRFRCTASLARRAALPAKLETLALTLGLKNLKDSKGKSLIKKFSMLPSRATKANPERKRIRPEDEPEAFAEFCEYCRQDVRAEQEVAKRLAYFDSEPNNSNYSLDAIINARGVPVNLSALRHAQKLIEEETEIVSGKFRELTGFEVTQNAKLLDWANNQGYTFLNLQAETIDGFLEKWTAEHHCEKCNDRGFTGTDDDIECEGFLSCRDCGGSTMPTKLVQALRMKQSIAYASIKKVATMLACAGPHDARVRGLLVHHGAGTGRWTATLVQPQNFRRSTIKDSAGAYKMICEGESREMIELCYGPVLEVIASCIRHFIQPV